MKSIFPLVIVFILVTGCEREVSRLSLNSELEQITLHTQVYQGDSIRIRVSKTSPVLGANSGDSLDNATIVIRKNNVIIHQLALENQQINYRILRDIAPGDTIGLEAFSNGLSSIFATDVMQAPINLDTIRFEHFKSRDRLRVSVKWSDEPGEDNFYIVSGSLIGKQKKEIDSIPFQSPAVVHDVSGLFRAGANNKLRSHLGIFNDDIFDGRRTQLTFEFSTVIPNGKAEFVVLNFKKVSPDYFRFISDLMNQSTSLGGPFNVTQNVFTNVSGGLGILGCMEEIKDTAWVQ